MDKEKTSNLLETLLTLSVWCAMGFASYWILDEYIGELRYSLEIGWAIACGYTIIAHYDEWWHTIISWVVFMCLSLAFAKFGIDGWWWLVLLPFPIVSYYASYRVSSAYKFDKMCEKYRKQKIKEQKNDKTKNNNGCVVHDSVELWIRQDKSNVMTQPKPKGKGKGNSSKIRSIFLAILRYGGKFRNYITSPKKTPMAQSVDERMISTIKWVGGLLIGAILALCACIVFCEYKDETSRYQKSGTTLIDTKTNSVLIRRGKEWKWEPIQTCEE